MPTGYDVGAAFERIEHELIDSMMRNLKRHLKEEAELGFDWTQWQVQQLNYLEAYRKKNRKEYGPQFRQINLRIGHAIRHARTNGQKEEEIRILEALKEHPELEGRIGRFRGSAEIMGGNFFKINESKLEALVKASEHDLTKAEHAVLRRCDDQYRQIIYTAQVYANTGAGTVEKAVDMATHDFLARGIDSIVYKNGARHTISDYADMYIRTAERRAYLMGAGEKRKEWGMELVIVNRRGTMTGGNFGHACPLCIPWLGKILIDDVYSGGHPDGKHELLSTAIQQGFLHPRCKDSFTTYFPGITSVPDPVTKKELKAGAEADRKEARRQYAERQAEKYGRLAERALDPENRQKYEAREEEWNDKSGRLTQAAQSVKVLDDNGTHVIDYIDAVHFAGDEVKLVNMLRSKDVQKISEAVNTVLEKESNLPKTVWNGKVILVSDGGLGRNVLGLAHWNHQIYICESNIGDLQTHVHEQLHMRSVIKYGKEMGKPLLIQNRSIEEGTVELLSQEILRKCGIEYRERYPKYVNPLRRIREIARYEETDYDFALKLIDLPIDERYTYLERTIEEYKQNNIHARGVVLKKLEDALTDLKGGAS